MRILIAAALLQVALTAQADAPGPGPYPGETPSRPAAGAPAPVAGISVERRRDGQRVISSRGDSAQTVTILEKSMPNLKAREARDWRELEGLRKEREAEREAALIHVTECYRQWGETSCVASLK